LSSELPGQGRHSCCQQWQDSLHRHKGREKKLREAVDKLIQTLEEGQEVILTFFSLYFSFLFFHKTRKILAFFT